MQTRHEAGAPASQGGQFKTATTPGAAVALDGACRRCRGQFGVPATESLTYCVRCEAELSTLFATERGVHRENEADWGSVEVAVGSTPPRKQWGKVNETYAIADGIVSVSCEGHGGLKLSPQRNRFVPAELRHSDGWYEEDCDYMIAVRTFPEAFADGREGADFFKREGVEQSFAYADARVRSYYPDEWETLTGRDVQPGESSKRDHERFADDFRAEHGEFATVSRHADDVPDEGQTLRFRAGDGKVAVISAADYNRFRAESAGKAYGVPIPQQYLRDVPVPPKIRHEPIADEPVRFDETSMSSRARQAAAKQYRDTDGQVRTLQEIVERRGVRGKTAHAEGAKMRYFATHGDGHVTEIGKAMFDALPAPHDEERVASQQRNARAHRLHDRIATAWDRDEVAKAKAQLEQLHREDQSRGETFEQRSERGRQLHQRALVSSTEATFYGDLEQAMSAAKPFMHADGSVRSDAPSEVRERLEELTIFGRAKSLF